MSEIWTSFGLSLTSDDIVVAVNGVRCDGSKFLTLALAEAVGGTAGSRVGLGMAFEDIVNGKGSTLDRIARLARNAA